MKNLDFLFYKTKKLKSNGGRIHSIILFSFIVFFANNLFAQTAGETCNNPIEIMSFPFEDSGNTGNYGNNYNVADVPATAPGAVTNGTGSAYYLDSAEAVYAFTPASDGTVDISITNDDGWTGLWVFTGCPFNSTVGYHTSTSGASRSVPNLPVTSGETYYIVISDWDNSINYTINVTGDVALEGAEDCEDVEAGTIVGTEGACFDVDFTLTAEDSSPNALGLSRQWQSSSDGETWEDIPNATSKTLSISITEDTYFRFSISCEYSDQEEISDAFFVTLKPVIECYCIPGGTNASYYINNFSTSGGIENIENLETGYDPNGYGDYFDTHLASQVRTEEINFQADYAIGNTFGTKIWVDWDQDGQFSEDEIVYQSSSYETSLSGSFEVPESAELGVTRMRIGISYTPNTGPNDPCESGSREFEDYAFEVLPLEDCEGTPTAGTVETEMQVCSGIAFTLSTEGSSAPADGLERIWQSSPAGEEDWTDLEGSNSPDFVLQDGITEDTDFRYTVHCTNSDESDFSEVIEVTLKPANECYCIPGGTNANYYINNFSTTGGVDNIENLGTGYDPDGYGDYFDTHLASQVRTEEINFQADYASGNTFGTKIWVDWNQDGQFSEDEIVYQSSSYTSAASGSFEVPESAELGVTRMRIGISYTPSSGPDSPCDIGSREFEDYAFEVLPLEDCEGTPTAGTVVEDSIHICAGIAFTLEVTGASAPANNLYRRWQSSPAGEDDWTDIDVSHYTSFTIDEGVFEDTDFRFAMTCSDEDSDYSDIIEVTLKPGLECYCTPTGAGNNSDEIRNFTLSNIDNDSNSSEGENGYIDYTESIPPAELEIGENYVASLTSGSGSGSHGAAIWIDFNDNGLFEEDEMVTFTSNITASTTVEFPEFTVPDYPGIHRLRVQYTYNQSGENLDPCNINTTYSETEDYLVELIQLEPCEGEVTAGDPIQSEISICPETSFIIGVENATSTAAQLERVWQYSPAGEDDWTDIDGANYYTYNVIDGIQENTDFRFKITCTNSDETDYSDIIEVTLKPANECYCTPGSSSTYYVNSFVTTGAEENIDHNLSSAPANGYGDFSDTETVSQYKTLTVDFSTTFSSTSLGYRIWVDWNQDGQFSDDEVVYQTPTYTGSATGTIEVPEEAITGTTIMRMGVHWLSGVGPLDPCMTDSYTSFQDFTFEVLELDDCVGMPDAGEPVEDSIYVCAGDAFTLEVADTSDPGNNLYRRWQSSPAGEDDWTDIDNSHYTAFTIVDGVFEDTDFRYAMTCNDEDSDYSAIIEVTLKPGYECYCIPTGSSNNADEILNFSLDDFSNDSSPSEGTNGYSDYTDLGPITLIPGVEYVASLTSNTGSGNHGAAIWIDYNDDGFFSEDEKVTYIGNTIAASSTVDFPAFTAGVAVGEHRLRVQYTYAQDGANLDPCNITTSYSETEDYTVLIVDVACFPPTGISIDYITDNSAQVTWIANDESEWLVTYGPTGFDPETEGESVTVTEPLADLTDLDDDTTYEVYVQTLCDVEDSVVIGPRIFTTNITPPENTRLCDAIELIPNSGCVGGPYTNVAAFEEVNEPVGSCLNDYHGNNTVWFTFEATDTEAVVTTDFNSTDFLTEVVVFEAPTDCADLTSLGEEIGCANASTEGTVELEGLTIGDTYYVKVGGFNNAEGLFCLEVQMDVSEVCMDPTDLTIGEIGDTFVDVSWTSTGNATQWEVLYGLAGFDIETEGESTVVNSTDVTITDLEPETDYEVYVRAICGDNNSDWVGPEDFTTEEMGVENQIFDDFSFYPNPVKEMLNLKAGSLIEKIEIFNLLGQKVLEVQPNNLESTIETDQLQSGTYLMNVTIEGVNKSFRVIKK